MKIGTISDSGMVSSITECIDVGEQMSVSGEATLLCRLDHDPEMSVLFREDEKAGC